MSILEKIITVYRHEPIIVRGVLIAVFALIATFGIEITKVQMGATWALIEAVMAFVSRASVYSPASVEKMTTPMQPSG